MTETLDSIAVDRRNRWADQTIVERSEAFDKIFVEHEDIKEVLKVIAFKLTEIQRRSGAINMAVYEELPRQLGAGLVVTGDSGAGKSTLARHILDSHPIHETVEQTYIPVVYMVIPDTVTALAMGTSLLRALGDKDLTGNAEDLRRRATMLMRRCRVKILIIDDFQDIPARRSGFAEIVAWLRKVIDYAPTLVLAMGTPAAEAVRDSDIQIRRRMEATAYLMRFDISSAIESRDEKKKRVEKWIQIIKRLDEELPLGGSSNLSDHKTALLLLRASNGSFSNLVNILWHAMSTAVQANRESLTREDLQEGFNRQFGERAKKGNPFDDRYDGAPLTAPGQVFGPSLGRTK